MSEEERAAAYRLQRVVCRTNLAAAELALAGDPVLRAALGSQWKPLIPDPVAVEIDDCRPVIVANRDCL